MARKMNTPLGPVTFTGHFGEGVGEIMQKHGPDPTEEQHLDFGPEPAGTLPQSMVFTLDMLSDKDPYFLPNGKRVDGVTTIVKHLDKPALVHAAWRLGTQGRTLEDAWYNAPAQRGKVAHGRIEAHVRDMVFSEVGIPTRALEESDEALERFKGWWAEHEFELIDAEKMMVSEELNCGGRRDLYALSLKRGTRALIDLKTSKGFYPEQKLQICGYSHMATHAHFVNPSKGRGANWWKPEEPQVVDELWIARVGNDEPGDMDALELSGSEIELHTRVFRGLAAMHYDLKKVLARR